MSDVEPGEYVKAETKRSRSRSGSYRSNTPQKSPSLRRSFSRSRSRSRSGSYRRRERSRSCGRRNGGRSRYSGSRSRSRSYHSRGRSHSSRSPMSNRKRHIGDRLNPPEGKCLGVFGLSLYTTESDLRSVFSRYGRLSSINIVIDQKTGRSRGFGFVYFEHSDDANEAKERANGMELDGRRIRVDFSITKRPHTPTPGVYVGRPYHPPTRDEYHDRYRERDDHRDSYRRDSYSRRSPSPYSRRRSPSPRYRRRSPSPYSRRRSPSPYYSRDRSPYRRY